MIALDTNVLVRYLAEADTAEGQRAATLLEDQLTSEQPGYVTVIGLAELLWVLRTGYRVAVADQRHIVARLLEMPQIVVERGDIVERAIALPHNDLADCILHAVGQHDGCSHTATFDRRFARLDGVEMIP